METNNELNYFAWVIGYECLQFVEDYEIECCDMLYDFSVFVATNFINSEEYKDLKHSSYEMFYKYLGNNGGIIKIFKDFFNIVESEK